MEPFTITTRMSKKDYSDYLYWAVYRKPLVILVILLGIAELFFAAMELSGRMNNSGSPYVDLGLGVFLILSPVLSVELVKRRSASISGIFDDIKYTFSEENIIENGKTCDATFKWEHMLKTKETKKFLLLYAGKRSAKFLYKDRLTTEQLAFIKSKVESSRTLKKQGNK